MKNTLIAIFFLASLGFCTFTDLGGGWVAGANIAQVRPLTNPTSVYFEVWTDAAHTTKTGFTFTGTSDAENNRVLSVLLSAAANGQTINFYRVTSTGTTAEHVTLEVP